MTTDYSLADIATASGGGMGNGGLWWIIILFLFSFMGGGYGRGQQGAVDNYVLASDFAQLNNRVNQIGDSLGNGICDATYALNTTLLNGFSGVNLANVQNTNAVQQNINQLGYNVQNGFWGTQNAVQNGTRDVIESNTANTRAILDAIQQNKVEAMQNKIAELTADNQALKFSASQCAQNAYLVNELRPAPKPAYTVANPFASGCGCGYCA